jgi:hypothetical protein
VDEVSDMDDIAQTVETLGDSVDWVIIGNRVKIPTTKFFQGSELEKQLLSFGAGRLQIPALLSDTRNHLRSREIQLGRGLSPAEALKNPSIQLDKCSHWRNSPLKPHALGNLECRNDTPPDLLPGLSGSLARSTVFPAGLVRMRNKSVALDGCRLKQGH